MITRTAIEIVIAVFVGQCIFDSVFKVLHLDTGAFWQKLVTLAVAAILTLIVGAVVFGIVVGIFYGGVFFLTSKSLKRINTT
ncbi:MAG: hypothetical protein ACJ71D_09190 [Nitrososphaera sp.]